MAECGCVTGSLGWCQGNCSRTCSGTCRDGCRSGCVNNCTNTCKNTCKNTCSGTSTSSSGCSGCSGSCSGGCSGTCSGTSSGTDSGGCSTCSGYCSGGCSGRCQGVCGSCGGDCGGFCTGGCKTTCGKSCTGTCGATCDKICDTGCTGQAYQNIYSRSIASGSINDTKLTLERYNDLILIISNELVRRNKYSELRPKQYKDDFIYPEEILKLVSMINNMNRKNSTKYSVSDKISSSIQSNNSITREQELEILNKIRLAFNMGISKNLVEF